MDSTPDVIERRKRQQMELAVASPEEGGRSAGWEDVHLPSRSLPGVSLRDLDLSTVFLGHPLGAPLVIVGMTGGHEQAAVANRLLGAAAQRFRIAVGVGSQRAALADERLTASYRAVREDAPDALVLANVGMSQLVSQGASPPLSKDDLRRAIDMVGAQALAIHLNAVEELIQTEGDRNTSGHLEAIAQVVTALEVPVVAKETGAGIDRHTARRLASVGVAAIDVGGVGGTSFALIEGRRAEVAGDSRGRRLGDTFAGWGIPTAASVLEARDCGAQVVASGGVRTGLDAAKALALGADLVGVGRPLLMAALEGEERLEAEIELLLEELRVAMVLCGVSRPGDLRDLDPVVTGFTHEWRRQRGLG